MSTRAACSRELWVKTTPQRSESGHGLRLHAAIVIGAAWLLVGMSAAAAAHPQLGEVARREAERRKEAAQTPGRVYTNENLAAVEPPPAVPQLPSAPSPEATVDTAAETSSATASTSGMVLEENPETHKVSFKSTTTPKDNRDEAVLARACQGRARTACQGNSRPRSLTDQACRPRRRATDPCHRAGALHRRRHGEAAAVRNAPSPRRCGRAADARRKWPRFRRIQQRSSDSSEQADSDKRH